MADKEKGISGAGLIVWVRDNKVKYQFHTDQKAWREEIKRLRETTPPDKIFSCIIDWDSKVVYAPNEDNEPEVMN